MRTIIDASNEYDQGMYVQFEGDHTNRRWCRRLKGEMTQAELAEAILEICAKLDGKPDDAEIRHHLMRLHGFVDPNQRRPAHIIRLRISVDSSIQPHQPQAEQNKRP